LKYLLCLSFYINIIFLYLYFFQCNIDFKIFLNYLELIEQKWKEILIQLMIFICLYKLIDIFLRSYVVSPLKRDFANLSSSLANSNNNNESSNCEFSYLKSNPNNFIRLTSIFQEIALDDKELIEEFIRINYSYYMNLNMTNNIKLTTFSLNNKQIILGNIYF